MARSKINEIGEDLINDGGSVLFSFVKGEQLEYPITLAFASNVLTGFTYEAVVVEGDNIAGQDDKPTNIKTNGIQNTLNVRVPIYKGVWDAPTAYNMEDIVFYNSKYYRLTAGVGRVSIIAPSADTAWVETTLNKIYIQFPAALAGNWSVMPQVGSPTYGFFELRVTEPNNSIFRRTWKPVRGMVEILFSPTDLVPDI